MIVLARKSLEGGPFFGWRTLLGLPKNWVVVAGAGRST